MKTPGFACFKYILCIFLIIGSSFFSPALAQKEANVWHFGYGAGVNFNYNPPRAIYGGQTRSNSSHASICDAAGNLLFYFGGGAIAGNPSPGMPVWNRNHQAMPSSWGYTTWSTNSIIVPYPGQLQKYYFFTNFSPGNGTSLLYQGYSLIDMSLNNGLGDVVNKNIFLKDFSYADIIAVKHRNNRDYWLMYQEDSINIFKSYLVSTNGLNTTPIVSTLPSFANNSSTTLIKASPDGTTLAFTTDHPLNTGVFLLNFDSNTGLITYKGNLPDPGFTGVPHGIEFSPDGSKLYYLKSLTNQQYNYELLQYDLDAGNIPDIINSKVSIQKYSLSSLGSPGIFQTMQVGPNGKIYSPSLDSVKYLNVIHRPNLKGKSCQFKPYDFDLDPQNTGQILSGISLPTFIQSYFYRPKITMQQTCFGDTAFFALGNPAYVDSVDWNFGDTASGTQNTSNLFNPKHFYATPGPKQVQAIVHFNFTSDTLSQTIYIPVGITKPNLGNDTTLCQGDTLLLNAYQPGASYEWQDSINTDSVYVVTKPGTYWVSVSNGCGTLGDSITVNFSSPLSLALPKDTVLCPGQTLTLQVNPQGGNLLWSDSTAANSFTVSKPGTYWAELSNACGSWRDSITVNYIPVVKNNWLPKDTILCSTAPLLINGTNQAALSYKWQDGSTFSSFTATVSGTYWLEITTACATLSDSIQVTINKLPETSFQDTTICTGDSFILTAPKALSYRWSTGDTAQSISINQAGKYKVEMETVKGCFYADSLEVKTERCFKTAFIPNIVTPNNDNFNDRFEPKGLETGDYELSIYNRWGSLIFHKENYTKQWPEEKISAGTYYYLLHNKQTGKTYKGWVEVVK